MFSSIRNSRLGYLIYSLVVVSLGIASLVFFWFMVTGFNVGVYNENTLVGSVYVGGLTEEEAIDKVNNRVNSWLANSSVRFEASYQGYFYEFDRDLLVFDIQQSFSQINDGTANPLVVSYRGDNRNFVKNQILDAPFLNDFDGDTDIDIDRLIDDILRDAANMKTFSRKEVHQYLIDYDSHTSVISTSNYLIPPNVQSQLSFYNKLITLHPEGEFTIEPYEIISVLDLFGNDLASSELNVIGGALLELITPTHMNVMERHYNPQIDTNRFPNVEEFPYYGINVRVNQNVNFDFRFENTNNLSYTVRFNPPANNRILFELVGLEHINEIIIQSETIFLPFDSETTNNEVYAQEGQNGRIISINRTINDINGHLLSNQDIIFEFYPPIKEIVYQP